MGPVANGVMREAKEPASATHTPQNLSSLAGMGTESREAGVAQCPPETKLSGLGRLRALPGHLRVLRLAPLQGLWKCRARIARSSCRSVLQCIHCRPVPATHQTGGSLKAPTGSKDRTGLAFSLQSREVYSTGILLRKLSGSAAPDLLRRPPVKTVALRYWSAVQDSGSAPAT